MQPTTQGRGTLPAPTPTTPSPTPRTGPDPAGALALRRLFAACLAVTAVGSVTWVALEPPFPEGYDARLAAIDEAGTGAAVSAVLFTASQLPWIVAVVGIAWLAHRGSSRFATVGGTLAVIGGFGHAVFGGAMLVTVLMSRDADERAVMAGLLEAIEGSPLLVPFMAAGLLGTVLGTLFLGVALWRSRVVPRWVPLVLWAFLVVEFVGTGLSDHATYLSSVCLLLAFGALAQQLWAADLTRQGRRREEPSRA